MEFQLLRQEYWSGLPFPSLGHLLDPENEPVSPAWQVGSLQLSHQGKQGQSSVYFIYFLYKCSAQYLPLLIVQQVFLEWMNE